MVNTAEIGRFDGEIKKVAFEDGDTVSKLLQNANLTLATGEGVNDSDGEDVALTALVVAGGEYFVVGNFKQGSY